MSKKETELKSDLAFFEKEILAAQDDVSLHYYRRKVQKISSQLKALQDENS